MTLIAVEIPRIGLVMENARLVRWLKQVGEFVRQGEPLLELETEKSLVEVESPDSGRLVETLLHADQNARVGDRVAWLESAAPAEPSATMPSATRPVEVPDPRPGKESDASEPVAASGPQGERVRSSPAARRLASQHGVPLEGILATGPGGRVQLDDVRAAMAHAGPPPAVAASAPSVPALSPMRRALARAMTLSNATVPQFVVERAVDWTELRVRRSRLIAGLSSADAPRPSVNDYLLQAVAKALLACPAMNATFAGDVDSREAAIVPSIGTHIGLVVAVEGGLIVPVLHDIEKLDVVEVARRRRDAIKRALRGSLKREELEGATISISNLGARGPDRFGAIISPPQSAILAVGRARDCVVALQGAILVRPVSELALTVDHRVADGRLASEFLAEVINRLSHQDPGKA